MNTPVFAKLNSGLIVLGKVTEHGILAKTFANRTQAVNACTALNGNFAVIQKGRPFYVAVVDETGKPVR